MNYDSALSYLNNYINYEAKPATAYAPEKFNLNRVRGLLELIDTPHLQYSSVHIAGTKGKGSVAAMTESVLRSAGHVTGLYTSPHIHDLRERIRVNGDIISQESFAQLLTDLQPQIEATEHITYYEIMTILALEWFARQRVEIAVLEVGLGGRLDATNVVTPSVCAITTISYDHMDLLGNTIEDIASEKAGIIKTGIPIVSGPQSASALIVRNVVYRGLVVTDNLMLAAIVILPATTTTPLLPANFVAVLRVFSMLFSKVVGQS